MGEIEDGAGALIEHVGIEALRPEQRNIPLEAVLHLLQPGELPSEHFLAAPEIDTRFETMLAGLQIIAEIAACRAGQQRKDERHESHHSPQLPSFPPKVPSFPPKQESSSQRRLD